MRKTESAVASGEFKCFSQTSVCELFVLLCFQSGGINCSAALFRSGEPVLCDSFVIKSAQGDHAINIITQINGHLLFYMLYVLFETLIKEGE